MTDVNFQQNWLI